MPAATVSYVEFESFLELRFRRASGVTLNDIGIVSTSIHRALNNAAAQLTGIRREYLRDIGRPEQPSRSGRPSFYDPLLVQVAVTSLTFESFSIGGRIRIARIAEQLGMNVAGSLLAAIIIWIYTHSDTVVESQNIPNESVSAVDVGPNLTTMQRRLSEAGGDWEMQIKDTRSGIEVWMRHKK